MAFGGAFLQFASRVLEAAKRGGLRGKELKTLEQILAKTGKRNTIISKGILSALSAGGAQKRDIEVFGKILMNAETKIQEGKKPFTESEQREINDIFKRAYISSKTARWFSSQIDELVAEEINEFISGARGIEAAIPARKITKVEREVEPQPEERKRRRMTL
ncbi:hypothetical protein HY990_04890 [Candidatus Micrarchaeota archaeon]|nr:hypothetical protein [Candidatus Micrarchaeota archaeon]